MSKDKMNLSLKCINPGPYHLTKGRVYKGRTIEITGDDDFYEVIDDRETAVKTWTTRFELVEAIDGSLYDFISEISGVKRDAVKVFCIAGLYQQKSIPNICKDLKLTFAEATNIISLFDEWTGADQRES